MTLLYLCCFCYILYLLILPSFYSSSCTILFLFIIIIIIDSSYLGPIICRPAAREISFCNGGGTSTRTQNCTSDESCSSSCRCFNGKDEQQGNTEEFTVNGIDGQGKYICSMCMYYPIPDDCQGRRKVFYTCTAVLAPPIIFTTPIRFHLCPTKALGLLV